MNIIKTHTHFSLLASNLLFIYSLISQTITTTTLSILFFTFLNSLIFISPPIPPPIYSPGGDIGEEQGWMPSPLPPSHADRGPQQLGPPLVSSHGSEGVNHASEKAGTQNKTSKALSTAPSILYNLLRPIDMPSVFYFTSVCFLFPTIVGWTLILAIYRPPAPEA